MAYDILIKSGLVIDGAGGAPITADIGIKDDQISAVSGGIGESEGKIIVNALGKYVVPGFIDITNHSDTHLTIFKYPALESMLRQGVTTAIGGNCGSSLAPLGSKNAWQAISKWADPAEINIDWARVGEFLDRIERLKPGANFGTFIGYGTLRRGVIGDETRLLNFEEREKVKFLLREGIKDGAFGLSLGLAYGHERVSSAEEIIEISRALADTGGIIKIHLRSEGKEILASVNEAVRIGRETGVPVQISHLKAIGRKSWPHLKKALDLIKSARDSGLDINFDVSPYSTTGSLLYLLIPAWARHGGFAELFKRLEMPEEKKKIIEQLKAYTLHYDRIIVNSAQLTNLVGKTMAEIAAISNLSPEEALVETVRANEGRVNIIGRTVSVKNTEMEIKDRNSFIASDGAGYGEEEIKSGSLVHPRSFGAFTRFWHRFVKDLKLISPEVAVRKVTSGPAQKVGLDRRGIIKKGSYADLVIFDPQKIKDRATYKNPYQYPEGIEWVVVNGQVAVENGNFTGVRAGRVLRKS